MLKRVYAAFIFCLLISVIFLGFISQARAEDITLGTIQELTPTDEDVLLSAWSPDGKKIAYLKRDTSTGDISGFWNIWIKEIGSANPPIQITQTTDNVNYLTPLTWSQDGTRILFYRFNPSTYTFEIAAAAADGSLIVTTILSDPYNYYYDPDISRLTLNNRLVYSINRQNLFSIKVTDAGDLIAGTEIQLTNFPSGYMSYVYPKWSYSMDKITFDVVSTPTNSDVYILNDVNNIINGITTPPVSLGNPRIIKVTNNGRFAMASGFSFDERLIYYSEDINRVFDVTKLFSNIPVSDWLQGSDFELFSMNADGSGVSQKIYEHPANQGYMIASPEGTSVSFIADQQSSNVDIFIASLLVSEDITTEGGQVIDGSGTVVDIPVGALSKTTTITIETPPLDNIPPSTIPLITARDFGPDGLIFNEPVTITIHYTDASIIGYNEQELQVCYYNETKQNWESLGGIVDPDANTVTVQTTHFSLFALSIRKEQEIIESIIYIHPDTLHLKSRERWINCYIELPAGYHVRDIDGSTVKISKINNETVSIQALKHPQKIGDYNRNGIPDLMVKFNRRSLIAHLWGLVKKSIDVKITVTGKIKDKLFEGADIIRVIPGH